MIGASAGGLTALFDIVRGLPPEFPAAVFVAMHMSPDNPGVLSNLLGRVAALPTALAEDRQAIERGRIYVARPDHHLLVKRAHVRVTRGPKENGFRPAIDPLFCSAAAAYGPRVIGVVLSGGLNDGTEGLLRITEAGGLALAQDPTEATIPSMPLSAIQNVEVHSVLRAAAIPQVLIELVRQPVVDTCTPGAPEVPDSAEAGLALQHDKPSGVPAPYTCPECNGALWEAPEHGKLLRFRCHVGHGFTAEALLAEQGSKLEGALWGALRALEENAALYRQQAARTRSAGYLALSRQYERSAAEIEEYANTLRPLLHRASVQWTPPVPAAPPPESAEGTED
ncbi:two-component system, chemotaxis family, response regulator CheB [Nannocystis exedens]|uniref:protein-glutamate methylesterase n=1 Tax=Nannocystis exedens TaxID=54 RepID=A0A1I2IVN4_9BACT|nr:chemotaxis protein CheB [Nannocystis exedens]PCC67166.1 Chemotaxis response regulator protein-glutamate methylesterase [Nannocystis exedens]SFF46269.1 two-component system, chemotaxis family, response regulator CheB [Nannocystis exedens]